MNKLFVSGFVLAGVMGMGVAQAGINNGLTSGILSSKEKCASALNNYLGYRHDVNATDTAKVQKLENQVDAMCEGYQIKLVNTNGVMTGVIELAD